MHLFCHNLHDESNYITVCGNTFKHSSLPFLVQPLPLSGPIQQDKLYFSYFFQKTGFDILCNGIGDNLHVISKPVIWEK